MKILLCFIVLICAGQSRATEKIWIPLGEPVGEKLSVIQGTPMPNFTPSVQSTPLSTSSALVKDGPWIYKYKNGNTESEGDYSSDKKDGIWKYFLEDGTESREMEFKDGVLTGKVLLWAPDGAQKYFDHFTDVIQKIVPIEFKVRVLLPYLVDLLGDGNHEIVLIARSDDGAMVLVLNDQGELLDSRTFDGFADDFIFYPLKKGGPIFFGYDMACALSGGVCSWEFDLFDGKEIKTVLQYQGWYGKSGPFTMPSFKNTDGIPQILTDNGTFQWNDKDQVFTRFH